MGLGTSGILWSTAVGVASMGAGIVVGLAFSAFTYWYCDAAENGI